MNSVDQNDRDFFSKNEIHFPQSDDAMKPIYSFQEDERINSTIREKLDKLQFINPTLIQSVALPLVLDSRDMIGISQTGSGKTLAFLIPAFTRLLNADGFSDQADYQYTCKPKVLVILPTRELAIQVYDEVEKFQLFKSVCLYGGSFKSGQVSSIRSRKPPIIIGTPGRLNDLIENGYIDLSNVNYLVLDEADRMLDMGFYPQITKIINLCDQGDRQSLMFSATWTRKVQALADPLLKRNRAFVSIGKPELKACIDIKQHLFFCKNEYEKQTLIQRIFEDFYGCKILVFCNTKAKAQSLYEFAENLTIPDEDGQDKLKIPSAYIHGDVEQLRRCDIIKDFNSGKLLIIFATDVASRGLDIKDINVVINYDFPIDVETYVHRIGRTGRNGNKGISFTFINNRVFEDPKVHRKLLKVVTDSGNEVPEFLQLSSESY